MLLTSDHGFLFNYNELTESSRQALPKTKGYARDHIRFVVADDFEGRQKEAFQIFMRYNRSNTHKMVPIPICEIPKNLK